MKAKKMILKDLEELIDFSENEPEQIHLQTYKMLNQEWNKNKKFSIVDLFVVELTDDEEMEEVILTVQEDEWERALELGLTHFESVENYEMCAKVKKLLETIKIK
jgi:hypothetical protein